MKSVAVLFFILGTSKAFWYSSAPSDCRWMHWEEVKCMRISEGVYKMLEKRAKIEAENGGKECNETEGTRQINSCSATQYVASTVIETMGSLPGAPTLTASVGHVSSTSVLTAFGSCATTFTDPSSGLGMVSAINCGSARQRRSADDKVVSRVKRQFYSDPVLDIESRDVLFLIDSSGSVGQENFRKEIALAKTLAGKFCGPVKIGTGSTRVAAMTFDSRPHQHISFNDYSDKDDFLKAMDKIPYNGGMTCLIDALNEARTQMFTKAKGSRVAGSKYDGLLIIITDGCLNCFGGNVKAELSRQELLFHKLGISIVSFMVGVQHSCVEKMRALADGSRCYQGFEIPSWFELDSTRSALEDYRCINRWTKAANYCP